MKINNFSLVVTWLLEISDKVVKKVNKVPITPNYCFRFIQESSIYTLEKTFSQIVNYTILRLEQRFRVAKMYHSPKPVSSLIM